MILSQLTSKFDYTSVVAFYLRDNSLFGAAFVFLGVAGAVFYSKIIDKTKNFKLAISIFILLSIIF